MVDPLDFANAKATNENDRQFILELVQKDVSMEEVGTKLPALNISCIITSRTGLIRSLHFETCFLQPLFLKPLQLNRALKDLLLSRMTDALLRHAFKNGDAEGARESHEGGGARESHTTLDCRDPTIFTLFTRSLCLDPPLLLR